MAIEVTAVGGYSEIGKNMTAVKIGNDVVILDMGVDLEKYVKVQEEREGLEKASAKELIHHKAIPDDSVIKDWMENVKAIVCTHAHLDHIAAIPFLAEKYKCPIIGTQYTIDIINRISSDNKIQIKNKCKTLKINDYYGISDDCKIQLINSQHSIAQTAIAVIHYKGEKIVYGNEYKFDTDPVLGRKINESLLKKLRPVNTLISDCIYADHIGRMPSESTAKEMIKKVFSNNFGDKAVLITTFASNLARLKSIIQYGKQTGREVLILGMSFEKYIGTAEKINIIDFSRDAKIFPYGNQVKKILKKAEQERGKYILVVTGHQGEPNAVLSKISRNKFPFKFRKGDYVIFSSKTIPTKLNIEMRKILENSLIEQGVEIIKDVHVSGHGAREDMRRMIRILKPKNLIPCHAPFNKQKIFAEIAYELGYNKSQVHFFKDGDRKLLK